MKPLLKQPAEVIHLPVEVGGLTTISALHSVSVVARGLVPGAPAVTAEGTLFANALTLEIAGGGAGERYLITVLADDADGQRREEEIEVAVLQLAWAMPDGGAPMLSVADFVLRFGLEEIVRMTDNVGNGRIDRDLLVTALIDAQAKAEGYLARRYQLPLDPVPVMVQTVIADLARARLYPNGAPEGIADAAKVAERTLEKMASGAISPGPNLHPAASDPSSSDGVSFTPGTRVYPDGLKDFGWS